MAPAAKGASSSGSGDAKAAAATAIKKKRKPGRSPISCLACRARRIACSLDAPCTSCVERGEAAHCSLALDVAYEASEDRPANQLKSQIDQLERMVGAMQARRHSPPKRSRSGRSGRSSAPSSARSSIATTSSVSVEQSLAAESEQSEQGHEAEARGGMPQVQQQQQQQPGPRQLSAVSSRKASSTHYQPHEAEFLAPLCWVSSSSAIPTSSGSSRIDLPPILNDLAYIEASAPMSQFPSLADPGAPSASAVDMQQLYSALPTRSQLDVILPLFFDNVTNPFARTCVARGRIMEQYAHIWSHSPQEDGVAEYYARGTIAAIAGLTLLVVRHEQLLKVGLPVGDVQLFMARSWLNTALHILLKSPHGREHPTLEPFRIVVLLNVFWLYFNSGKFANSAVLFNANYIAQAFELRLNQDPDQVAPDLAWEDKEERRALFWSLVCVDGLARAALSKAYNPVDILSISTTFPTQRTGIFLASLVSLKVSKLLANVRGASPEEVTAIHDELQNMQDRLALRQSSVVTGDDGLDFANEQFLISCSLVRLHRSRLVSSVQHDSIEEEDWHVQNTVHHSRVLLACITRLGEIDELARPYVVHGSLSAALTAACLMLDVAQDPGRLLPDTATSIEHLRNELALFLDTIHRVGDTLPHITMTLKRGHAIAQRILLSPAANPRAPPPMPQDILGYPALSYSPQGFYDNSSGDVPAFQLPQDYSAAGMQGGTSARVEPDWSGASFNPQMTMMTSGASPASMYAPAPIMHHSMIRPASAYTDHQSGGFPTALPSTDTPVTSTPSDFDHDFSYNGARRQGSGWDEPDPMISPATAISFSTATDGQVAQEHNAANPLLKPWLVSSGQLPVSRASAKLSMLAPLDTAQFALLRPPHATADEQTPRDFCDDDVGITPTRVFRAFQFPALGGPFS